MSFKRRVISLVLTSAISIGGYEYITNRVAAMNNEKIIEISKNLKDGESYTDLIVDSLKTMFNETSSFRVMSGEIELNHTYKYKEGKVVLTIPILNKEVTLLDPEIVKSCKATAMFDYDIKSLSNTIVEKGEGNTIKILVDYPTLNKESVKRKQDSLIIDTENTKTNFDAKIKLLGQSVYSELKETMDARAMRGLEDSFDRESPKKIEELYLTDVEKAKELEQHTISSLDGLVNGFLKKILNTIDNVPNDLEFVIELKDNNQVVNNENNINTENNVNSEEI